jgi:hypothetical protein
MNTHLKTVKMTVSQTPTFMISSDILYRPGTVTHCLSTRFRSGATTSAFSYYLMLFLSTLCLSMTRPSQKHERRSLLPVVPVEGLIVVHGEVEGVDVVADVAAAFEECQTSCTTQNDDMGTPRHVFCMHSIGAYLVLRGIKNIRSSIPMRYNTFLSLPQRLHSYLLLFLNYS